MFSEEFFISLEIYRPRELFKDLLTYWLIWRLTDLGSYLEILLPRKLFEVLLTNWLIWRFTDLLTYLKIYWPIGSYLNVYLMKSYLEIYWPIDLFKELLTYRELFEDLLT